MATTLTRNLKLRVASGLTSDAKYNLQRIDQLGAVFNLDNQDSVVVRSSENLYFRPNDASIGGTGTGGSVEFGAQDQPVESVSIYSDAFVVNAPLSLADQAVGGDKKLLFEYNTTLNGSVDTAADRVLKLDLDGASRNLVLGCNVSMLGNSSITFTASSPVAWTLPTSNAAGILYNNGSGTLSWSSAGAGTVTSVGFSAASPLAASGGPITTSGTLSIGFQNQAANYVLAGPTSGGASAPTFRALAAADFQAIPGYRAMSAIWNTGTSITITHNWNTRKVLVEILDGDNQYREVLADDETRPTDNTVVLTANEAPANWLVLLKEVP